MANKGMGRDTVQGHQGGGNLKDRPDDEDVAAQAHGNNQLQGQNQTDKHNERRAYPDTNE